MSGANSNPYQVQVTVLAVRLRTEPGLNGYDVLATHQVQGDFATVDECQNAYAAIVSASQQAATGYGIAG